MVKILRIDPLNIDHAAFKEAAKIIKKGGLVAFPTETVYGMGANVFDPQAVRNLFISKARPSNKPLAVCISSFDQFRLIAVSLPAEAEALAEAFLPGPLTMVLLKDPVISDEVTANSKGVGIRFPDHPIALALIEEAGVPIATSSANISGDIDARSADEVDAALWGEIDLLIDGGPAQLGVASTVVDLTSPPYRMLREGALSTAELDRLLLDRGFAPLEAG